MVPSDTPASGSRGDLPLPDYDRLPLASQLNRTPVIKPREPGEAPTSIPMRTAGDASGTPGPSE